MNHTRRVLGTAGLFLLTRAAFGAPLEVGPGKTYAKPCAAFAAAAQGDTIEIDAAGNGTYDGDVCAIAPSGLTIRGINGRAHIDAAGQNSQGKAIWVVQGDGTTIENVELSGAAVPDHNGAGIRAEGKDLTIRRCYFHDNEEGILGGAGEVLIELSEFAREGNCIDPAGCAHNMYISNSVTKFTLRYSYSHSVTDGHLVKSRAQTNYILENRLTGESGTDSYEIDLPNAGTSYVVGNLVEQGPNTGNPEMLAYGEEGASNAGNDLYVVNNTFVNDHGSGTFVAVAGSVVTPAVVKNNIFLGPGTAVSQSGASTANNFTGDPMLKDRAGFDYHLLPGSPCIDAGTDPGTANGFSLTPTAEYVHPANFETRTSVGVIDIGAYEFGGGSGGSDGGPPGSGGSGSGTGGATSNGGSGNAGNGGSGVTDAGSTNTASGGAGTGNAGAGNGNGGTSGAVGSGGNGGGGLPGGANDVGTQRSQDTGGCGCRAAESAPRSSMGASVLLALAALGRRRRKA